MEEQSLIEILNAEMDLQLPPQLPFKEMRARLQEIIGQLMNNDFQHLVNVLYRVDVNERKLKYLLQENVGEDAAVIIADLIIERQMEKMATRRQYRQDADAMDYDEEKW